MTTCDANTNSCHKFLGVDAKTSVTAVQSFNAHRVNSFIVDGCSACFPLRLRAEDDLIIRRLKNSKEGVELLPAAVHSGGFCGLFFCWGFFPLVD